MSKGQIFSIDMNVSLFLFISFITVTTFIYNYISLQLEDHVQFSEMIRHNIILSDNLIRSQGYPEDWNSTDYVSIGLSSESNVISGPKIDQLEAIPYNDFRTYAGVEGYQVSINISSITGEEIFTYGNNSFDGDYVFPIKRLCIFDNGTRRPAFFELVMWK